MVKGSGVLGALVGAGGATAYHNGVDVSGTLRTLLMGGQLRDMPSWHSAASSNRELDSLYKLVEQLSRDVHRQQGVTISMASNKGQGTVLLYTGVAAGAGYIYLRVFRGWRLTDLMYVTRSSLSRSLSSVTAGVDGLTQRLSSMRSFVQQQIVTLTAKQDDTLAAQVALEKQLGAVGDDVEETSRQVAEVHSSVKELENNLDDIATKQQYANEGIYLLCRVVGDLMRSAGHRLESVSELDTYLRRPRGLMGHVQVLPMLRAATAPPAASAHAGPGHAHAAASPAHAGGLHACAPSAQEGDGSTRGCRVQGLEGLLRQAGEEGDSDARGEVHLASGHAVHWAQLSRAPTA